MIPIYTTRGDVGAILVYPHLFNLQGEWIGWVTPDREVYGVHGLYAGTLSREMRIVRRHAAAATLPRRRPPAPPAPIRPPSHFPLAPQMPELPMHMIDVLEEEPERLPAYGSFEAFLEDGD